MKAADSKNGPQFQAAGLEPGWQRTKRSCYGSAGSAGGESGRTKEAPGDSGAALGWWWGRGTAPETRELHSPPLSPAQRQIARIRGADGSHLSTPPRPPKSQPRGTAKANLISNTKLGKVGRLRNLEKVG